MIVNCPFCSEEAETDIELVEGQHVLCPNCGQKFSYHISSKESSCQEHSCDDAALGQTDRKSMLSRFLHSIRSAISEWLETVKGCYSLSERISRRSFVKVFIVHSLVWYVLRLASLIVSTVLWKSNISIFGALPLLFDYAVVGGWMFLAASFFVRRLNDASRHVAWALIPFAIMFIWDFNLIQALLYLIVFGLLNTRAELGYPLRVILSRKMAMILSVIIVVATPIYRYARFQMILADCRAMAEKYKSNAPFKNISWNCYSRDGGMGTYFFNTDGPARAQFMAVYCFGRLQTVQLMDCADQSKVEAVESYIREHFELEASLLRR